MFRYSENKPESTPNLAPANYSWKNYLKAGLVLVTATAGYFIAKSSGWLWSNKEELSKDSKEIIIASNQVEQNNLLINKIEQPLDKSLFTNTQQSIQFQELSIEDKEISRREKQTTENGVATDFLISRNRYLGRKLLAIGDEFRVNTYTINAQCCPSIATLTKGGFVVAWASTGQDGSNVGIYGQRYDVIGSPLGAEFRINNPSTPSVNDDPSVAGLSNGGFVVTWSGQDGSETGIYAQRYDAVGSQVGAEFRVNTYTIDIQKDPSVAGLTNGGFVVTWSSYQQDTSGYGIYAQRYDALGSPAGSEFRVNTYIIDNQRSSSAAGLSNGGFVVTWQSTRQDSDRDYDIYGQRYDAAGSQMGSEFRVNTYTIYPQEDPSVAGLSNGEFVVIWSSLWQDGSNNGVYGQRYDALGSARGSEFRVNTYTSNSQSTPSVASLTNKGFVVTWASEAQDGSYNGIYGQCYDAAGSQVGSEFQVSTYTTQNQEVPSVASLNNGGFVVTWNSHLQDGSGYGVYGKIFSNPQLLASNGVVSYYDQPQPVVIDNNITISGLATSVSLQNAIIQITTNFVAGQDYLNFTNQQGINGFYNTSGGILNLTGIASVTAYQTALRNVSYQLIGTNSSVLPRTFSFSVTDTNSFPSNTVTRYFDLTARNGEFRVNTYTTGTQWYPSVTGLKDGGFVVTWESTRQDNDSSSGIYAQRYDALGKALNPEFRINTYTIGEQTLPSVAALSNRGFVVTWQSDQDGSESGIYAQRYDAVGSPVGSEFRVNTYTLYSQADPSVAGLSNGGFVVTWSSGWQDGSSKGVYGQRYEAFGSPVGSEFRVNTYTLNSQESSSVTGLTNGGFVVAWVSEWPDGSGFDIYAQRYDAVGSSLGSEFRVNIYPIYFQSPPSVAGLSTRGFVVTWSSDRQDGSRDIYGQRYDAAGSQMGSEFRVNTYTLYSQAGPSVAGLTNGGFMVTWESEEQDDSKYGIYGQCYDAAGSRIGSEFQVNTYTTDSQHQPSVASLSNGGFVVTWSSMWQDNNDWGIYGKFYSSLPTPIPTPAPTSNPTSQPTFSPTWTPTLFPTFEPTLSPTSLPTQAPTFEPTFEPTPIPTLLPTFIPTAFPTLSPTPLPTKIPTFVPTLVPTWRPSEAPTFAPTMTPSPIYISPLLSATVGGVIYFEGNTSVIIDKGINITYPLNGTLQNATVAIVSNCKIEEDRLLFIAQSGITGRYSQGVLNLFGNLDWQTYQALLRTVAYNNTSKNPSNLTRLISFIVNDGIGQNNTVNRTVEIVPIEDVPSLVKNHMIIQGKETLLTEEMLQAEDVDSDISHIFFHISSPQHGYFAYQEETQLIEITVFTQEDINQKRVVFIWDEIGNPTYTIQLANSRNREAFLTSPQNGEVTINIKPNNKDNTPNPILIGSAIGGGVALLLAGFGVYKCKDKCKKPKDTNSNRLSSISDFRISEVEMEPDEGNDRLKIAERTPNQTL